MSIKLFRALYKGTKGGKVHKLSCTNHLFVLFASFRAEKLLQNTELTAGV